MVALLTGYADPPEGFTLMDGMNYNRYFPGHQIAMPQYREVIDTFSLPEDRCMPAVAELVHEHEDRLRRRVEGGLAELGDHVTVHSVAEQRTPTLFFTFAERDAAEAYRFLGERDVLAPAGSFYAYEPFRALGLPVDSGMRVGLAPYTDDSDVDRLLTGLREFLA